MTVLLLKLLSRLRAFVVYGICGLIFVVLHYHLSDQQWQTVGPALLIVGFIAILAVNSIHVRKR